MSFTQTSSIVAEAIETSDAFWSTATSDGGAGAISVSRCIDWLLDLRQATDKTDLRGLVDEVLDELQTLNSIDANTAGLEMGDLVLGALASVEVAFEVATA